MTATPCFKFQTYNQVKSIIKEFQVSWENSWQYEDPRFLRFDVFIYKNKLYTLTKEQYAERNIQEVYPQAST